MADITVTGNEAYFNNDVKFFKDLYIYGISSTSSSAEVKKILYIDSDGKLKYNVGIITDLVGAPGGGGTGTGGTGGSGTGGGGESLWAVNPVGIHTLTNVGIGLDYPLARFHVSGDSIFNGNISVTGSVSVGNTISANNGIFTGNVSITNDLFARNGIFTGDISANNANFAGIASATKFFGSGIYVQTRCSAYSWKPVH